MLTDRSNWIRRLEEDELELEANEKLYVGSGTRLAVGTHVRRGHLI